MVKKLILFLYTLIIISDNNMIFIKYCLTYWLLFNKNITQDLLVKKEKLLDWRKLRDSPLCETKW